MKKNVIIKAYNKNSAQSSSDYLKDLLKHEFTIIRDDLNYKSETLRSLNNDWSIIDAYEDMKGNTRHAKEFIVVMPNELILDDKGTVDKEQIDQYINNLIEDYCEVMSVNKSKAIFEIQVHINLEHDGEPMNLHAHILGAEREIEFEPQYERYDRNYYYDRTLKRPINSKELDNLYNELPKVAFEQELKERNVKLSHEKGDIKYNKDGSPKLKNGGEPTFNEKKNRELNLWRNLEAFRERTLERHKVIAPNHEYIIGRDPDKIQEIVVSKKMENSHPKKAEAIYKANKEIKKFNKELEAFEPQRKRAIVKEKNEQIKTVNKEAYHKREDTQISIYNSLCEWLVKERNKARDLLKEATKKVFNFAFKDIYDKTSFFERLEQKTESEIERTTIDNTYKAKPKIERIEGHFESLEQAKEYLSTQQYLKHYKACEGLEIDNKLKDAELTQERGIERHIGRF
jgi:hypothetical protein